MYLYYCIYICLCHTQSYGNRVFFQYARHISLTFLICTRTFLNINYNICFKYVHPIKLEALYSLLYMYKIEITSHLPSKICVLKRYLVHCISYAPCLRSKRRFFQILYLRDPGPKKYSVI